jgi:hypothetical protein
MNNDLTLGVFSFPIPIPLYGAKYTCFVSIANVLSAYRKLVKGFP